MSGHVAVWIDHQQARFFRVRGTHVDEQMLAAQSPRHRSGGGSQTRLNEEDAKRFFGGVAQALDGAEEILVMGPSSAKHELVSYLHVHEKLLSKKVVGVEVIDYPSDKEVVALAKRHFRRVDATL